MQTNSIVKRIDIDAVMEAAQHNLWVFDFEHPEGYQKTLPLETRTFWPIRLHSLMAELQNSAYAIREGHILQLLGVYPTSVFNLTEDNGNVVNSPVCFRGDMPLDYGFAVLVWKGAVVNTDILYIRAHYSIRRGV